MPLEVGFANRAQARRVWGGLTSAGRRDQMRDLAASNIVGVTLSRCRPPFDTTGADSDCRAHGGD